MEINSNFFVVVQSKKFPCSVNCVEAKKARRKLREERKLHNNYEGMLRGGGGAETKKVHFVNEKFGRSQSDMGARDRLIMSANFFH